MRRPDLANDPENNPSTFVREYSPATRIIGMAAVGLAVAASGYAIVSGLATYRDAFRPQEMPAVEAPDYPNIVAQQIVDAGQQGQGGE